MKHALLITLIFPLCSFCQDYYDNTHIRYEDFVYKKNIKTTQLYVEGLEISYPALELNSTARLVLGFDDLEEGAKEYHYTIVHCDVNWIPSNIADNEYIDGFLTNHIAQYQPSFNTIQKYTHYKLIFPNENFKIKKSGNYILKIYEGYQPDNIVLTKRFVIFDSKVTIQAKIKRNADPLNMDNSHEIDFEIFYSNHVIGNPYNDVKVVLLQNGRWDNAITNLKPLFVQEDKLIYDYNAENLFQAGNEFRRFDFRSMRYMTERIKDIAFINNENHIYLLGDKDRCCIKYAFEEEDINGHYVIRVQEGDNNESQADYSHIHFKLPYEKPIHHGNIYIFGSLTNWRIDKEFQMQYDYKKLCYEATLFLKQGFYNYEYVFADEKKKDVYVSLIEGSHFETENDYRILVYVHNYSADIDELIGYKTLSSDGVVR